MNDKIYQLIFTLSIGGIGSYIAIRLKVSAGAMIGAVIAVSIFGGLTGLTYLPEEGRIIIQIIAGAYIGANINRNDIVDAKSMFSPALFMLAGLFLTNCLMGALIFYTTPLNWDSALLATTPGGK